MIINQIICLLPFSGLTQVAEFPQRVADTEREINEQLDYYNYSFRLFISSLHVQLILMYLYGQALFLS